MFFTFMVLDYIKFTRRNRYWLIEKLNKNGELHRLYGPARKSVDGHEEWWVNGKLHRLDGPAIIYSNGSKDWWVNGERHRLDGPAFIYSNGYKEWWVNSIQYTEEEFKQIPINIIWEDFWRPKPENKWLYILRVRF